jgi:hypothetical protein
MYPAVALLAAVECVAFWRRPRALRRLPAFDWDWRAGAAVVLLVTDISLALAVPVSRTVQEDGGRQEEFVENVAAGLPLGASLHAAANFPETVLLVLSFRLRRNIEREPPDCYSQGYYLTSGDQELCSVSVASVVVSSSDYRLKLLRLSPSAQ